jgi:hypothetical protein
MRDELGRKSNMHRELIERLKLRALSMPDIPEFGEAAAALSGAHVLDDQTYKMLYSAAFNYALFSGKTISEAVRFAADAADEALIEVARRIQEKL